MTHVALQEWSHVGPDNVADLRGLALDGDVPRRLAVDLARAGRLVVRELRNGIEIEARQWVGRVRLGSLTITVQPKIAPDLLLRLYRYAFGLRGIDRGEAVVFDAGMALHDLLIIQLANEVDTLIRRGLSRRYSRREASLASPRGKIDIGRIAAAPITTGTLPCSYHERDLDWRVNQAVRAGMLLASRMSSNQAVASRLRRSAKLLDGAVADVTLSDRWLAEVRRALDRQTEAYASALTIIHMLLRGQGLRLDEDDDSESVTIPGFLFDMNLFFESLLGRFLGEHLPDHEVRTQDRLAELYRYPPNGNPRRRRRPDPRPDFVLVREGRYVAVLDAKYRDLWDLPVPREMLYQLSLYALALPGCREAVILYPCADGAARDAVLELRAAVGAPARVVVRPVRLEELDAMLDPRAHGRARRFAENLIGPTATAPPRVTPRMVEGRAGRAGRG